MCRQKVKYCQKDFSRRSRKEWQTCWIWIVYHRMPVMSKLSEFISMYFGTAQWPGYQAKVHLVRWYGWVKVQTFIFIWLFSSFYRYYFYCLHVYDDSSNKKEKHQNSKILIAILDQIQYSSDLNLNVSSDTTHNCYRVSGRYCLFLDWYVEYW